MKCFALAFAVALSLSACGKHEAILPDASSPGGGNEIEREASGFSLIHPIASPVQNLTSNDGKIHISIKGSHFQSITPDPEDLPRGLTPEDITLLQYDANSDIMLYITQIGQAKTDAKTYFNKLKMALTQAQAEHNIQNLTIGISTDNRMNYRFAQTDKTGNTLQEYCIALHSSYVYDICANSRKAEPIKLAAVLKDIQLSK